MHNSPLCIVVDSAVVMMQAWSDARFAEADNQFGADLQTHVAYAFIFAHPLVHV